MTNNEVYEKISVAIKQSGEKRNSLQMSDEDRKIHCPRTLEEEAEYMLYLINHEAFQDQDTECLKAAYLRILKCIEEQKKSEIH